jgi:predicted DNA-binding protein (MmcQ/YjbR family)
LSYAPVNYPSRIAMTLEAFHTFAHSLRGVTEDFPFNETVLALRVRNRIFALIDVESHPLWANLKCDPERAQQLRAEWEGINPGYHMNKQHWNKVGLDEGLPASLIRELIEHSYDLIVAKLPKKEREALAAE